MIRLIDRLLGYHIVRVSEDDLAQAASRLIASGVGGSFRTDGSLVVAHRHLASVCAALDGLALEVGPLEGLLGVLLRYRHRYGMFAALLLLATLMLLSRRVVWDIRLEGTYTEDEAVLLEDMADCGLFVGARWDALDFSRTENAILSSSDTIGWISIYRRGLVAYVTVTEKTQTAPPAEAPPVGNIVATEDAVVDEILVHRGYQTVKKGDTVRQGDLLISGVLPSELGGGILSADGVVMGRVERQISVRVPSQVQQQRTVRRTTVSISLNFFGFSINNFKKDGNLPDDCAIIEEKTAVTLFGRYRLPITLTRRYACEMQSYTVTLSAEQMTQQAAARLEDAVRLELSSSELVSLRTEGTFENDVYTMTAYIVCRRPIGTFRPLQEIENETTG